MALRVVRLFLVFFLRYCLLSMMFEYGIEMVGGGRMVCCQNFNFSISMFAPPINLLSLSLSFYLE